MTTTYEHEINIAAPRERVWRALTESRELEAWFCEHADVSLDDKRFDFWGRFTQTNTTRDEGRHDLVDIEGMELLRFRFPHGGQETLVEITLEGDTRVRVLHTGVAERSREQQQEKQLGADHLWTAALVQLRGYLERGLPGPRFDYTWPTKNGFTIEAEIRASKAEVFEAIVPPPQGTGWTSDQFRRPARNEEEDFGWDVGAVVGIKLLDIVPPDRLELAWIQDSATTLTYTLAESDGRTRLTLVHSGFGGDTDEQGMAEGFFSGLVELAWTFETNGAWPPVSTLTELAITQPYWRFGVHTLQGRPTGR